MVRLLFPKRRRPPSHGCHVYLNVGWAAFTADQPRLAQRLIEDQWLLGMKHAEARSPRFPSEMVCRNHLLSSGFGRMQQASKLHNSCPENRMASKIASNKPPAILPLMLRPASVFVSENSGPNGEVCSECCLQGLCPTTVRWQEQLFCA